jgi:hypothetical protein
MVLSIKRDNEYKKGGTPEIYLNVKMKVKKWVYFLVIPKKDPYLNNRGNLHLLRNSL